jgi:hypothetical protein
MMPDDIMEISMSKSSLSSSAPWCSFQYCGFQGMERS